MSRTDHALGQARRLFAWWADQPLIHVAVLLAVSILAVIGYMRPELVTDLFQTNSESESGYEPSTLETAAATYSAPPSNVRPFRVAGGECVVVARSEQFFTRAGMTAIRQAVEDLEALPQVHSVLWLDSVPGMNLFGLNAPLLPHSKASSRQMEAGRGRATSNPLAVGQLISSDGQTILLHLQMDWFYVTSDEACTTELRRTAEAAVAKIPDADVQFQVTGPAPLELMMADSHVQNALKYQLIGYGIMLLSALILFRGVSAVVIVALAPAMGVFWTMGWLHFFDLQDNQFNDIIVPVLIALVGLTDAVHLMVEIRNQRATGLDIREASRRGVSRVGLACVLTSVTTAIGFASLAWAHHEIVRQFGWCCVLGVGMTLTSVLTIVPLGCRSPLGRRLHVGLGKSLVDSQLRRIGPVVAWTLRHDRKLAWTAVATTILLAALCLQLEPDEKRYSGLSESGEAAQALRHLDETMGGLEFGYVQVSWDPAAEQHQLLDVLADVDRLLEQETLIGHPIGLHQLLEVLPGEGEAKERMTLLELLPPSLKRAFYTPEYRQARVQFRVQDIGIAKYGPVFERLEEGLQNIHDRHPLYSLELVGDAVWRWKGVYQIVTDLAASLGSASIVIWIVMTLVYRSVRIGLISIVPNVFPLVATGAVLLLTGQYLEIVTVCVFTICIGIAVDDTIHFLTRYVEERDEGDDHQASIQRAFSGVGSALLMTTIVLVAGMLTAVMGDARDARLFGMMGALTLIAALFADILFLPALLSRFGLAKNQDQSFGSGKTHHRDHEEHGEAQEVG